MGFLLLFHELEVPNRKQGIKKQIFSPHSLNRQELWESNMQPLLLSKYLYNVYSFRSFKGEQPLDLTLSLMGRRLYVTKVKFSHITDYYSMQGKDI